MKRIRILTLNALLAFACVGFLQLNAQETAPAASPASPSPSKEELTLWKIIQLGGWCMWPLGLCSVAGVALVIYNGIAIRPAKLLRPEVVAQLQGAFDGLDVDSARNICVANPGPVTNIALAGLARIKDGEIRIHSIEKAMEEASVAEITGPLVPINYLSVIGVISPMIGLLGTVSGMISGFHAMALGGMGRPELLADSISEALITTASGLVIGIPVMVAYFFFKNRYTRLISSMNRVCGELVETLEHALRRYQRGDLKPTEAAAADEGKE